MAIFPSNVNIPKATEHFTTLNLSSDHVTTQDFFKLKPVYTRFLVPGQSINVDMSHMTRLAPLRKPFYGSVTMTNRAFFVPFRVIMEGFNEFITDTPYTQSNGSQLIISDVPRIQMSELCKVFQQSAFSYIIDDKAENFDFSAPMSGTTKKYNFLPLGRYALDVLNCLGYQLDFSALFNESNVNQNYLVSALPILSFVKIFVDYFENTNFAPDNSLQSLFKGTNKMLLSSDIASIFGRALYASYENDYFTSSWSNPSSPYNSVRSSYEVKDVSIPGDDPSRKSRVMSVYGMQTPQIVGSADNDFKPNSLTTYILTALQSLSDYMKRHQLSGYRAVDRFRSRFGITLPNEKLNRSVYLGKSESPIEITDVTSTADTAQAVLGQYSGFGISRSTNGKFSYKTDEYGIFVILSIISPIHASYANGMDRHLFDLNKLDFYTPEFDGLGCQPIANAEIKSDFKTAEEQNPLSVWAYIPRYSHYKCGRDVLSGDFKVPTRMANMANFHLFRSFNDVPAHNLDFCTGKTEDFLRIFNDNSPSNDHFFTTFHFDVRSDAPMSPLFENYHFEEAGKEIEQKVGGTRLS